MGYELVKKRGKNVKIELGKKLKKISFGEKKKDVKKKIRIDKREKNE